MRTDFKSVMDALFAHLVGAATLNFTADVTADDATLANVSDLTRHFAGLPVFGPGISSGAVIAAIDEDISAVTLSIAPTEDGATVALTTGFLTTGRRVKHWTQVANQPALFLRRTGVSYAADAVEPYIVTTLDCEAWIYCNAGQDPDVAPDDALTSLEQMVIESFVPDGDDGDPRFTIGGLVYWCRFEGRADISPGDQGPQAIARLPIRITLP